MASIASVIDRLEAWAPAATQESWDNSGLQVGRPDREVSAVVVALDLTPAVIDLAMEKGAGLIVTHHPLFFAPIKAITPRTLVGNLALHLAEEGIAHYAIHTNLDVARDGVSFSLARQLGLTDLTFLDTEVGQDLPDGPPTGLGAIGSLEQTMTSTEFLRHVRRSLDIPTLRHVTDPSMTIRRVAVCGGSGSGFLKQAMAAEADAYVTADVKYHQFFDALDAQGQPVIAYLDVGHYESEAVSEQILIDYLNEEMPDLRVIRAEASTSPVASFVAS